MADHTWEDHAEPAFNATEWVLNRLLDTLQSLVDNELEEHGEFEAAVEEVKFMIAELQDLRNACYSRREGDLEDDEDKDDEIVKDLEEVAAEVDVQKIMKEQGIKEVDGVHYREEAYTGAKAGLMVRHEVAITDYLNGKESWEQVLERIELIDNSITYPLKEKHGPVAVRLNLGRYAFLFYNPRVNLMSPFILLDEVRGDRNGVPNRVLAQWSGLGYPGAKGTVRIFRNDAVVANKDCTHFSQLITLLEDMPPDFLAEEVQEARWHKQQP